MNISESLEIIKSMADSSRLAVLNTLMEKSQYVEEIGNRLNLAVSTVSFHLKKLEKAGLVYKTKEQYYIIYHLNKEIFNKTLKEFLIFKNPEKEIQDERVQKYRQKVLSTFFKGNKLIKIPVQYKKRLIILEEFTKEFTPNVSYTEEHVNESIQKYFDDHCTIRRLLVEYDFMKRENQIYWLNTENKLEK